MRFSDLISLIIDNLSRRKGRVMLTAIGVVIGTAAVVTLVSLGAGLQASATSNLWGITDLASVQVSPGYPEYQSFVPVSFTEDDIKKITPSVIEQFKAMPGVKQVVIKDYLRGGANLSYDKMEGWGNFQALN
ncbi:MAG TPA: ABC transporter permease, partial [Anaerolineaceae bacterium]|nr:ABC transporter permease [Anaerolineaceae bacterium]